MKRFCGLLYALCLCAILLTACNAAGMSSQTDIVSSTSIPENSSKTPSEPTTSSAVISFFDPNEISPEMTYGQYFGKTRQIKLYSSYFTSDANGYLTENGKKVFPYPIQYRSSSQNIMAQTKTGLLYADTVNNVVWRITGLDRDAEWMYQPYWPYRLTEISPRADECAFFVTQQNRYDESDVQICRVFCGAGGGMEIIATSEDFPGKIEQIYTKSNHVVIVESNLPYKQSTDWSDDWTTEDALNAKLAARRYTIINTKEQTIVSSDDAEAFAEAVKKLPGYWY